MFVVVLGDSWWFLMFHGCSWLFLWVVVVLGGPLWFCGSLWFYVVYFGSLCFIVGICGSWWFFLVLNVH